MGAGTANLWITASGVQAWRSAAAQYGNVADRGLDAAHSTAQEHIGAAVAGLLQDHPAGGDDLGAQVQVFGTDEQSYVGIPSGPGAERARNIEFGTAQHPPAAVLRQTLTYERPEMGRSFARKAWGGS